MRKQLLSPKSFFRTIIVLISSVVTISAAPGDLDTSFGIQGQLQDVTMATIRATVVQPDGKIVVAGGKYYVSGSVTHTSPALARYNTDGSLDYTFGTEGWVLGATVSGSFDAVALQSDGKIVAVGRRDTGLSYVARFNANGTFDTTFSSDGKLEFSYPVRTYESSRMTSVAILSNGKIVAAGTIDYIYNDDPYYNHSDLFLVRINANGSFDATFGTSGKKKLDIRCDVDVPTSIAIHPTNDRIALSLEEGDFAVAVLNTDGSFDTSFGGTGHVEANFGGVGSKAYSLAFQRYIVRVGGYPAMTTRLVVGGYSYLNATTEWDFALARFKMDGTLDASFDGDGMVRKSLSYQKDIIRAIRIDSADRIVTAGPRRWNSITDFAVVRFTRDGDFDTTFGNQGKVYTKFYSNGNQINADACAMDLTGDGKIVVAGGYWTADNKLLARYEQ